MKPSKGPEGFRIFSFVSTQTVFYLAFMYQHLLSFEHETFDIKYVLPVQFCSICLHEIYLLLPRDLLLDPALLKAEVLYCRFLFGPLIKQLRWQQRL